MAVSVVLDACVLYPIGLRDTLLNLAEAGCFHVLWTEEILAETSRNIVDDVPGLTREHLEKTFTAMRRAFPDAMIDGYQHLVSSMTNHPKDRHVLAAAVAAQADGVVTLNTRHFPTAAGQPHGIFIQTPDQLLCEIAKASPQLVVSVLTAQAGRKARPPMTVSDTMQIGLVGSVSLAEMLNHLEVLVPRSVGVLRDLAQEADSGDGSP